MNIGEIEKSIYKSLFHHVKIKTVDGEDLDGYVADVETPYASGNRFACLYLETDDSENQIGVAADQIASIDVLELLFDPEAE